MVNCTARQEFDAALLKVSGIEPSKISDHDPLADRMDSLEALSLIIEVEEVSGIEISDETAEGLTTRALWLDYLEAAQ